MQSIKLSAVALTLVFLVSGCAYQATVRPQSNAGDYLSFGAVPGAWALHVGGYEHLRGEANLTTFACGAHTYPFNYALAFRDSVWATLERRVGSLELARSADRGTLENGEHDGLIIVHATAASATLAFQGGMFGTPKANGHASLSVSITVEGRDGRILSTTVTGAGTANGAGACPIGRDVIRIAAETALSNLLQEAGATFSNHPYITAYASSLR